MLSVLSSLFVRSLPWSGSDTACTGPDQIFSIEEGCLAHPNRSLPVKKIQRDPLRVRLVFISIQVVLLKEIG